MPVLIHCLSASNLSCSACSKTTNKHFSFYSKNDVRLSQKTHKEQAGVCPCCMSRMALPTPCPNGPLISMCSRSPTHCGTLTPSVYQPSGWSSPVPWRATSYFPGECGQIWPWQPHGLYQTVNCNQWSLTDKVNIQDWTLTEMVVNKEVWSLQRKNGVTTFASELGPDSKYLRISLSLLKVKFQ